MTEKKPPLFTTIRNRILAGVFVVVPLAISLWVGFFLYKELTAWGVWLIDVVFSELARHDFFGAKSLAKIGDHLQDFWFVSLVRIVSLFVILLLLFLIGVVAKWTIGRKILSITDHIMKKVPMLNTVYSTIQQIGDAIWAPTGSMFRQVVLFEYPRKGMWVIGFLTNENKPGWELDRKTGERLYSVFLPTTPNPTSGFLLFIPKKDCVMLDMDITEGMQLIISGGAVPPTLIPDTTKKVEGNENQTSNTEHRMAQKTEQEM